MSKQPNRSALKAAAVSMAIVGIFIASPAAAAVITVNPGESINAALRRASAGDTVRVNPGTYREAVNINRDGVRLESATPGGAHIIGGGSPAVQAYGQSNIAVVGFRMTSSGSDGVKIGGSKHRDVQNITFTGNTLTNSAKDGFKFFQINGLRLIGNTIQNAGSARNGNGDGGIDFVRVDNALVQGNRVIRTYGHACLMMKGGSSGNRVIGNSFRGCERDGITVGGFTSPQFLHPSDRGLEAHNNEIVGNEVEGGPGKCPFYFRRAENNRIENNRLFGGRPGCNSGGGSNGPGANVDVSGAGSGDNTPGGSGDEGEEGEQNRLEGGVSRAMAQIGRLSCSAGQTAGAIGAAANTISGFFGGGRATFVGQMMQQAQLILANICLAEQAAMQAKMIARGGYNDISRIRRGINSVNNVLHTAGIPEIPWDELYPEEYEDVTSEDQIEWKEKEVERQYEAGMTSKDAAEAAMENLETVPERSEALLQASQDAPGQLSAIQAGNQAIMMGVEIDSSLLATQIAHNQTVEAYYDRIAASERRSVEYKKRQRRGLPGYGDETGDESGDTSESPELNARTLAIARAAASENPATTESAQTPDEE